MSNLKTQAEAIFRQALAAVDVRAAVRRELTSLVFDGHEVLIVAIGKAASAMCEAALAALADRWAVRAIVVAPEPPASGVARYFYGAHPTPGEGSREAAAAILAALRGADAGTLVLFLISGGASAMVEMPVDPRVSMAEMAAFHRALVASGLPIGAMNSLRKRVSAVKGGGLAEAAARAGKQLTLIVSDVPAGGLDVVGSGPSMPDAGGGDWRAAWEQVCGNVGGGVARMFEQGPLRSLPTASDAAFARARWVGLLSSDDLARGAVAAAHALGYSTVVDNACDEWESGAAVEFLLSRAMPEGSCLISVGEVAVKLGETAGVGGRNQHFVLQAAQRIGGRQGLAVLSAGSDGVDGNSPAAGAVADGETWARAKDAGRALAAFDSYPVFAALGDAVVTGPTGNNVRDLRLVLRA